MDNVKECLKKCRLYCFNSRNGIKNLLNIPKDFDLENVRDGLLPYYNFFYLKKPDLFYNSFHLIIPPLLSLILNNHATTTNFHIMPV